MLRSTKTLVYTPVAILGSIAEKLNAYYFRLPGPDVLLVPPLS